MAGSVKRASLEAVVLALASGEPRVKSAQRFGYRTKHSYESTLSGHVKAQGALNVTHLVTLALARNLVTLEAVQAAALRGAGLVRKPKPKPKLEGVYDNLTTQYREFYEAGRLKRRWPRSWVYKQSGANSTVKPWGELPDKPADDQPVE